MAYEDKTARITAPHSVVMEERSVLTVSAVEEVERFDEQEVVLCTVRGTLTVRGTDLHIERLNLDGGELRVSGSLDSLVYEDEGRRQGGFFARLLH